MKPPPPVGHTSWLDKILCGRPQDIREEHLALGLCELADLRKQLLSQQAQTAPEEMSLTASAQIKETGPLRARIEQLEGQLKTIKRAVLTVGEIATSGYGLMRMLNRDEVTYWNALVQGVREER